MVSILKAITRSIKAQESRPAILWMIGAALVLHAANLDHLASWDDSLVYLVGARSLAEGHGYVLLNAPEPHPPIRMYPPLLSILLSGLWRLWPDYPANLPLLKVLPLGSALAFAVGCAVLLRRAGTVPVLALAAGTMFLFHAYVGQMIGATVLSDLPAAAVAVWALILARQGVSNRHLAALQDLALCGLVAASLLLRAASLAVVLMVLVLLVRRHSWRAAVLVSVAGILALSWYAADAKRHPGPPERLWYYGGATSYGDALRYTPEENGGLRERAPHEIVALVSRLQLESAGYLLTDALPLGRLGLTFEVARRHAPRGTPLGLVLSAVGCLVSGLTLLGSWHALRKRGKSLLAFAVVTYLVSANWPGGVTFLARYMLPADIFLNLGFLAGVSLVLERLPSSHWMNPRNLIILTAFVIVAPNAAYLTRNAIRLHAPGGPTGNYYRRMNERDLSFRWIAARTDPRDLIAAHSAIDLFLKTGRHAIPFVEETLPHLPTKGVRWILLGPEDYADHSAAVDDMGGHPVWRSPSGAYIVFNLAAPP